MTNEVLPLSTPSDLSPARPGRFTSDRFLFGTMFVSAAVCLLAAFVLTTDAFRLAENPNVVLGCDVNQFISCGTVATSWQASVFGFPNALLGLMFEPIVITTALAGFAGVRLPRWLMVGEQLLYLFAVGFALWLFYQSAFKIHALCPWCLVVTFGTIITFFALLRYNLQQGNLGSSPAAAFVQRYAIDFLAGVVLIGVVLLIIVLQYGPKLLS